MSHTLTYDRPMTLVSTTLVLHVHSVKEVQNNNNQTTHGTESRHAPLSLIVLPRYDVTGTESEALSKSPSKIRTIAFLFSVLAFSFFLRL